MKKLTVFVTEDGSEFITEEEAKAHERVLTRTAEVKQWVEDYYPESPKKQTEYFRVISKWLYHQP